MAIYSFSHYIGQFKKLKIVTDIL